ncbi:MAG: glycosyltransferase [bacterium]
MISIVIPTLNEAQVLADTIKNIRTIISSEIEIIVTDGNSSDETIKIAKKLADKLVIHNSLERQTIAHARNAGAALATGDYLLFLDADVVVPNASEFMRKILAEFQQNLKLVAVTVKLEVLPSLSTWSDILFSKIAINWPHLVNNNILKIGSASGEFQFIRRSVFNEIGGFNEKLVSCEDLNMFERLARVGETKMLYSLVVYHTGRRFHKIGWSRVLMTWIVNIIYYKLFGFTKSKEWTVVR